MSFSTIPVVDGVDICLPEPRQVVAGNETLAIYPLKVGQLPSVLRFIRPLMPHLTAPTVDWLGVLAEHGDALLQCIAVYLNKPRAWVDALEIDEVVVLAATLVEVNADFLIHRVMPKLARLMPMRLDQTTPHTPAPSSPTQHATQHTTSHEIGSTSANI